MDKLELMPIEKSHRDQLANLMIRFACQVKRKAFAPSNPLNR